MQYGRCECGAVQSWDSGMPQHDCQGCEECNTTIASYKTGHKPLQRHKPKKKFNQNTGEFSHYHCSECYERCDEDGNTLRPKKSND
jgi:hypothetical protein